VLAALVPGISTAADEDLLVHSERAINHEEARIDPHQRDAINIMPRVMARPRWSGGSAEPMASRWRAGWIAGAAPAC
jgi:hypothetical protein